MKSARAGMNTLAIFAILFLLGFGFVVYAVPETAAPEPHSSSSSTSSTSAAQGNVVYYQLVHAATNAKGTQGANASGYARISISGQSLALEWSVTGAAPGEQLQMTMQVASTTGTIKSLTFTTVQVSSQGTAGSSGAATLDPGYCYIGLIVVDPSTTSHATVFTSDPTSAQVAIASTQTTTTTTATGDGLSYSLVPLPVYLYQEAPSNYSFKEGGALIAVSGNQLQVTASFLGVANTRFLTVIQTTHQNITAGWVTTTSTGGGVFKGNVTLSSGTYQIGLLIYVYGNTASPVGVSAPRAIEVTLPVTGHTSSTTKTTSTTTRSSSSSSASASSASSTLSTTSSRSTGAVTSTSSTSSQSSEAADHLEFTPITTNAVAAKEYSYGEGGGGYSVTGGTINFSLAFTGQKPSTHYSLVLTVNGTTKTIGNYTTTANGGGNIGASTVLGTGSFVLGLTVVDTSSFNSPTEVLASVPPSFTVNTHVTTTNTSTIQTTTSTTHASASSATESVGPKGPQWNFELVAATNQNVPDGYRFATSGTAVVSLDKRHSLLNVVLGFQGANPSTEYNAAIVLNGTSVNLGSMTTNKAGGTYLQASIQVSSGKYLLGVLVYDVSDVAAFNSNGPILVMLSDPNTQLAEIGAPAAEQGSSVTSTSQTLLSSAVTTSAATFSAGADVQEQIHNAFDSLTIPATVQITPLLSSTTVLDSRFSLSVGQQIGNGLAIGISGENVTGPRVLLINMSRTSPLALYPALNITLDGVLVTEASSALQVLNPLASNPPMYVLVATSNSIQLLVSIPHFSLHLIQIAGVIVHNVQAALELDAPLLVGSILVITLAFAGAYAARKRYFSILI